MVDDKKNKINPANFFLIAGLILGILYCIVIPYGAGFDEERHMTRIYYMSQGEILPNFPDQKIHEDIADLSYQRRVVQSPAFDMFNKDVWGRRFSTFDKIRYGQKTQSIYSPVIFLPQALIGRIFWWKFDFPILPTILLQKIAGLLIYIVGAYIMIRKTPYGKWMLAILALFPSALYQATTINADGFTTAVSFAFIGWTLYVYENEASGITARSAWTLFSLSLLLGMAKPGAIVLLPLLFILYKRRSPSQKWVFLLVVGVLLAAMINVGWWVISSQGASFAGGGSDNISKQLTNAIANPSGFLIPLLKGMVATFPDIVKGWIAIYGYAAGTVPLPVYFFSVGSLLSAYLTEPRKVHLPTAVRLFLIATFVTSCFAIYSMVFAAVFSSGSILGLTKHGRYNIPFGPLFFLAITGFFILRPNLKNLMKQTSILFILLTHVYFSIGIYATYYTYCGYTALLGEKCTLPIYKNLEKESNLMVGVNSGEIIKQSFTNQCGRLEAVAVFVESIPESGNGSLRFSLLGPADQTLASHDFPTHNVLANNYLTLPVELPFDYKNKNFTIELETINTQFPEKFRFVITHQDYYPGQLTTQDGVAWGDLLIHYTCTTP